MIVETGETVMTILVILAVLGLLAYPRGKVETNHKRTMAKFRAIERFSSF